MNSLRLNYSYFAFDYSLVDFGILAKSQRQRPMQKKTKIKRKQIHDKAVRGNER